MSTKKEEQLLRWNVTSLLPLTHCCRSKELHCIDNRNSSKNWVEFKYIHKGSGEEHDQYSDKLYCNTLYVRHIIQGHVKSSLSRTRWEERDQYWNKLYCNAQYSEKCKVEWKVRPILGQRIILQKSNLLSGRHSDTEYQSHFSLIYHHRHHHPNFQQHPHIMCCHYYVHYLHDYVQHYAMHSVHCIIQCSAEWKGQLRKCIHTGGVQIWICNFVFLQFLHLLCNIMQ